MTGEFLDTKHCELKRTQIRLAFANKNNLHKLQEKKDKS